MGDFAMSCFAVLPISVRFRGVVLAQEQINKFHRFLVDEVHHVMSLGLKSFSAA
jgi:hypothetical protein